MLRNGGEVLFNALTEPWEHPERGKMWNSHGLTISNRSELHLVPETKLADLRQRTVDKEAIPCIIPAIGTADLNSTMWFDIKKQLSCGNCKFLIDENEYQETLEKSGEYFSLGVEEIVDKMMPYVETSALIYESINLDAEYKSEKVKLVEKRSMTKDKSVVMSYGNYVITKIENQWAQAEQEDTEDMDTIQLVW